MFAVALVVGFVDVPGVYLCGCVWVRVRFVRVVVRMRLGEVAGFKNMDLGGCDSGAVDPFNLQGGVKTECGDRVVEDMRVEAGVDQGAEKHVAGDAGEAVEVGETHEVIVARGPHVWPCASR